MVIGLILIAVGIIAILVKADVLSGSIWDYTWPTVLVIIGLSFLLGRLRRRRWWWGWCCPPWDDRDRDRPDKQ
jgi:predicted lysophospholipase L1 biosynthesis ABC-type transport system permease subunit